MGSYPPPFGTDAGVFTLYVCVNTADKIIAHIPNFFPTPSPTALINWVSNLFQLPATNNIKLYLYGPCKASELLNILPYGVPFYIRINGNYSNTIDIYKRLGVLE